MKFIREFFGEEFDECWKIELMVLALIIVPFFFIPTSITTIICCGIAISFYIFALVMFGHSSCLEMGLGAVVFSISLVTLIPVYQRYQEVKQRKEIRQQMPIRKTPKPPQ